MHVVAPARNTSKMGISLKLEEFEKICQGLIHGIGIRHLGGNQLRVYHAREHLMYTEAEPVQIPRERANKHGIQEAKVVQDIMPNQRSASGVGLPTPAQYLRPSDMASLETQGFDHLVVRW